MSFRNEIFRVVDVFIFNLDRTVGGVQCHNIGLFDAVVEGNLLGEDNESPGRLLDL